MAKQSDVKVGRFEATFTDVRLPFGLTVDLIRLTAANATVKRNPFKIKLETPGAVVATVGESNLQEFLEDQAPGGLRDFEIKLKEGKVHVKAGVPLLVGVRAKAVCSLRIVDEKEIWVELESVDVLGVGAKSLVEKQLEKINPVLDASDFPFDVKLEKVMIVDGELVVKGTALP